MDRRVLRRRRHFSRAPATRGSDEPCVLEAAALAERFGFHELDIEDVLSKRQRPKIDEYPDYLFVVLRQGGPAP
jgi:hypothetical protein